MRDSDYNLYRKFLEVAKYNSFTKAAENLCISQPAVTQSVKKLEETLNTELFVRNIKNIELSERIINIEDEKSVSYLGNYDDFKEQ